MTQLPFQAGTALPITEEEEGPTEIISNASTADSGINSTICHGHSREVFMMRQPLHPPEQLDILSGDVSPGDMSDEDLQ